MQKLQKIKPANHLLQNYDIKIPVQYKPWQKNSFPLNK